MASFIKRVDFYYIVWYTAHSISVSIGKSGACAPLFLIEKITDVKNWNL